LAALLDIDKENNRKMSRKYERKSKVKRRLMNLSPNNSLDVIINNAESNGSPMLSPKAEVTLTDNLAKELQNKQQRFQQRTVDGVAVLHYGDAEIPDFKMNPEKLQVEVDNFGEKSLIRRQHALRNQVTSRLNCDRHEYVPVDYSHTENLWSIGFVQVHYSDDTGVPTLDNLILVGKSGSWVRLDLSRCTSTFSLFPGQILRVYGRNPAGTFLHVDECEWKILDEPKSLPIETTEDFVLGVATGPYTLEGDFDYIAIKAIKEKFASKIDCLILVGPFVPENMYNKVENLTSHQMMQNFVGKVQEELCPLVKQVVLVNAYDEAAGMRLSPQPACFCLNDKNLDKRLIVTSEPARLGINGVSIFVSGTGVMDHLVKAEVCKKETSTEMNKMARLSHHILYQKSFYPLLPAKINIDIEQVDDYLSFKNDEPDLLIFSSQMKPSFNLNKVLNAGQSIQRGMAGYFTRILFTKSEEKITAMDILRI